MVDDELWGTALVDGDGSTNTLVACSWWPWLIEDIRTCDDELLGTALVDSDGTFKNLKQISKPSSFS